MHKKRILSNPGTSRNDLQKQHPVVLRLCKSSEPLLGLLEPRDDGAGVPTTASQGSAPLLPALQA